MQLFALKSANMPNIWENVTSHLNVKDIANLLKVSSSVRRALGESLKANSKMCLKLNVAATVSAIAAEKIASKVEVQFKRERSYAKRALAYSTFGYYNFCAIDKAWYHMNEETYHVDILKLDNKYEKVYLKKSLIGERGGHNSFLSVVPTQDAKRIIIKRNCTNYVIRSNSISTKLERIIGGKITSKGGKIWEQIQYELPGAMHNRISHCAQYRLYEQKGRETSSLFMTLLNSKGRPYKSKMLHKLKFNLNCCKGEDPGIVHIASNDEVIYHDNDKLYFIYWLFYGHVSI